MDRIILVLKSSSTKSKQNIKPLYTQSRTSVDLATFQDVKYEYAGLPLYIFSSFLWNKTFAALKHSRIPQRNSLDEPLVSRQSY